MQASTASACFRRLSDWVNSVSNPHASGLCFMVLYLFSPGFRRLIRIFLSKHRVLSYFFLDIHSPYPSDYRPVGFESSPSLWHSQTLNGHYTRSRRFTGGCSLRSLSVSSIPYNQ